MAIVRAFRATRFARLIPEVVAPPYDVIDDNLRQELGERNPYNIVHLTLPAGDDDRYARAARLLQHWLSEGVLRQDPDPAIYRYTQRFVDPLSGSVRTRTGYFVLLHTEPYENGVVLPHEQTFPGVKEDRYRLLQAARTHMETIFGLFEDTPAFQEAIADAMWEPMAQVEGDDLPEGAFHKLERIANPVEVSRFERAFANARVWIADGHHRYETALRYGQTYGSDGSPERFVPILLVPLDDPGLVILPTHRVLAESPPGTPAEWQARLQGAFECIPVAHEAVLEQMAQHGGEAIGFVWREGAWLIRPKAYPPVQGLPDALTRLDSWVLHERVMPALGYTEPQKRYTRSAQDALESVRTGAAQAAFLLNPPPLRALQQIASAGGKMPHKSTYFHPKVLSGLILWQVGAMKVIGVIPARLAATRLPNKPLLDIAGKPMIQWVWERASQARTLHELYIATPDPEIVAAAHAFGAQAMLTSHAHRSGTDRMAEVARNTDGEIYVNIQGDEPLLNPEAIDRAVQPCWTTPAS